MSDVVDRAREEFFAEAQEIIEGLGRDVLGLDDAQKRGAQDPELVNDVFRAVHTLKGLAALFGALRLSALTHELEELLDDLRLGRRPLDDRALGLLFQATDICGRLLQAERDGDDGSFPDLTEFLVSLRGDVAGTAASSDVATFDLDPGVLAVLTEYEEHRLRTNVEAGFSLYRLRVRFELTTIDESLERLKSNAKPYGEIITYLPTGAGADIDRIELDILLASKEPLDVLTEVLGSVGAEIEPVPRAGGKKPSQRPRPRDTPVPAALTRATSRPSALGQLPPEPSRETSLRSVSQTVRVDIRKLDLLMNVVGELGIVRSGLERLDERLRLGGSVREIRADLVRLERSFERHLEAMQQGILEVRMVPLGQVFERLARVARQLSREADKDVHLVITGAETEVDKLIVEELSDPLMHMMRNAIDHGIEPSSERLAVGKPEVGTIALNAFQKGNHVVIELEDDGRGIDTEKLVLAALGRGAIGADEVRSTSRKDILNLIFLPGVSTRQDVSEVSGRGVGMDIVKTNIGRLGGIIDIQSELGIGTKLSVTLPITLAIIRALVVEVAGRSFAIPLTNVQEAVVMPAGGVHTIDERETISLRGSTLRIARLATLFDLRDSSEPAPPREYVVVAEAGQNRLGLVVDRLIGGQDVVIKAFGTSLRNVRGFAGAADLGDQRLGLVVDTLALLDEMSAGRARPVQDGASRV
jgi:two-component system chemotaxis sensor kinase CheA